MWINLPKNTTILIAVAAYRGFAAIQLLRTKQKNKANLPYMVKAINFAAINLYDICPFKFASSPLIN
jgi:hypothetical protein